MLFHEWDNMVDVERSTNKIMASNFDKSNIKEFLKVYKKESQKGCLGNKQGFLLYLVVPTTSQSWILWIAHDTWVDFMRALFNEFALDNAMMITQYNFIP